MTTMTVSDQWLSLFAIHSQLVLLVSLLWSSDFHLLLSLTKALCSLQFFLISS